MSSSKAAEISEKPIDMQKAVQLLGGNTRLFYNMLGKLESMSLVPSMKGIADAMVAEDYLDMKAKAHSLKGASGYIGASNVHYSCFQIQAQFEAKNFPGMIEYYPMLVESAIEFKIACRTILAENKGKFKATVVLTLFESLYSRSESGNR